MKEQNLQSLYQHRHGDLPIAIGMKVETKHVEGLLAEVSAQTGGVFIIVLPVN
jgi:hypothetical protein